MVVQDNYTTKYRFKHVSVYERGQIAALFVGVDLNAHAAINLYVWSEKVRELTRIALNTFIPSGADTIYSVVDAFADSAADKKNYIDDLLLMFIGFTYIIHLYPETL